MPVRWAAPLILALLSCGFASSVAAQELPTIRIISRISIEGLRRESEADLLASLREHIRVGDPYSPEVESRVAGQLYLTQKFRRVRLKQRIEREDSVELIFEVEERPSVLALAFEGRRALSVKHLKTTAPALRTRVGSLFNESHLVQDEEALVDKYHEAGYVFATVKADVQSSPEGVRVRFVIDEGTRVRVREVRFEGNHTISSSELRGVMSTRKKGWLFGLLTPGFYDYETLERDLRNIRAYYGRRGFFDVRAELKSLDFDDAMERLTITVAISEGQQYQFRGYRFRGNAVFPTSTLEDLTTGVPGEPFDMETVQRDRDAIFNYYGDRAYIEAQVEFEPKFPLAGTSVFVDFDIEENNEIYIEEVRIRGNDKTRDPVIRRELEFFPGERVDRSKIVESRSNLHRLQYFNSVQFDYEPGSAPGSRHVVVNVEEESTGRLILGFGVTSGFGVIGNFSISKRNFDITDFPDSFYDIPDSFTGAGQTLNLAAQPGTRRSLYRFSLTEPYLFNTRNSLTVTASKLTVIRRDYDEDRASFAPRVGHRFDFDRDFVVSMGGRIEDVEIRRIEADAPQAAFDADGHTTVVALSAGVDHDKVLYEYLEGPYDGTLSSVLYEYAGGFLGGEVDFHKLETTNEFYFPLYVYQSGPDTLHHVVSLKNRFGWIEPHEKDDDIPIFERFFLGGPNSVRGFRFRGMGPHEGSDPVGGTAMVWGNLEYSFPIVQKMLRGVLFVDYGNLAPTISRLDVFDRMRVVVGGGLRLNFPFLGQPIPIGLYLGTPLRDEPEDRTRVFLFTIGARF